jgi:hypothetical protein
MKPLLQFILGTVAIALIVSAFHAYEISKTETAVKLLIKTNPEFSNLSLTRVSGGILSLEGQFQSREVSAVLWTKWKNSPLSVGHIGRAYIIRRGLQTCSALADTSQVRNRGHRGRVSKIKKQ